MNNLIKIFNMKKILLIFLALTVSCLSMHAQQDKNTEKKLTKFEEFSSKTGVIMKFADVTLPDRLQMNRGVVLYTSIRTIMRGSENVYFYRLYTYGDGYTAWIEYSDLVEINKAVSRLVADVDADVAANPEYLENKFMTSDGFEVGYYVSKQKVTWYLKLKGNLELYPKIQLKENFVVYPKRQQDIVDLFEAGQRKIEELRTSNDK